MAGIRSDTRKGRLSLVKERGGWGSTRTFHWLVPLTFILFPYRKARGDKARKGSRDSDLMRRDEGPISCGRTPSGPLQIVWFSACNPRNLAVL